MAKKTNVTALFGVASLPINQRPEDVGNLVRELANMVKRGEITALAIAYVMPNHTVLTDWASGTAPANLLSAGAARLQWRIQKALEDDK